MTDLPGLTLVRAPCPQIERIEGAKPEQIRAYLGGNRPVVLAGAAGDWHRRWTPEAIIERFGASEIDAEETREVYVGERALVRRPLGPVVEGVVRGATELRWKGLEFLKKVPAMGAELGVDPAPSRGLLPPGARELRDTLWIAPEGTMSSLHHDGDFDNLNVQISGRKLFRLLPPPSHRELYAYGSAESPINPFAPDLGRFPGFRGARAVEAMLHPGDTLLLPKYWWHCVYAFEPSVNLSTHFRWEGEGSPWETLRGAPLVHRALTALAAGLKRRRMNRLADAGRRVWFAAYSRAVPRVTPQPRCRLVDDSPPPGRSP